MKDSEQQQPCCCPAQDLPLLVLLRIFQELGPRDIALGCARVCKSWHAVIAHEQSLWRSLCQSRYLIAPPCPAPEMSPPSHANGADWQSILVLRFATESNVLKTIVIGAIQHHGDVLFHEDNPVFDDIHALTKLSLPPLSSAVAPAAADLLTHVVFTSTYSSPSLGFSAWTLLRHLRWSWILHQLDTPADPSPEYLWSLLSAAHMLHLDPVTQVIRPLLSQLDSLAREFSKTHPSEDSQPLSQRLVALGQYLFATKGFQGNKSSYHSPDNSLMHKVLSTRLGIPISLSVLLSSVARRLDPPIPVSLVAFPSHFLARFDDPTLPLDKATLLLDPFNYDASRPSGWMAPVSHWQQVWAQAGATGVQVFPQLVEPTLPELVFVRILNNLDTAIKMRTRTQPPDDRLLDSLYVTNSMLLRVDRDAAGGFFPGVGARTMQRIDVVIGLVMRLWHLLDAPLFLQSLARIRGISDEILRHIKSSLTTPLSSLHTDVDNRASPTQDAGDMHSPGTLFVHKKFGYLGVVLSADPTCQEGPEWQQAQGVARLERGADQPFYHSLALDASGTRYVAHENVHVLSDQPLEEISTHLQARVRALVAEPNTARSWLHVRGHDVEVRQGVVRERPEALQPELEKMLMVGRYFERFDWERWRFVPVATLQESKVRLEEDPKRSESEEP